MYTNYKYFQCASNDNWWPGWKPLKIKLNMPQNGQNRVLNGVCSQPHSLLGLFLTKTKFFLPE